jgi:glycosyltransferase involved in cell wall biosynthesis
MRPAVSVVIPTYNRAAWLSRAIESVITQTVSDWEIILVDDGSTDQTAEVAGAFRRRLGGALTCIHQPNRGCCSARNQGIAASRGAFIAFLDSDDEFLPRKLERQLTLFEKRPELGLVYSDYSYIDLDGNLHVSTFDTKAPLAREAPCEEIARGLRVCTGSLFDTLLRGYFVATIVGLVRREALETIRFADGQRYSAEWLFYLQLARNWPAGFVDEPLSLHHHLRGSVTRTDKQENVRNYFELLKRIERAFPDLNLRQRAILRPQLARAALQIAYQAHAAGDFAEASRLFAVSLGYGWSMAATRGLLEECWRTKCGLTPIKTVAACEFNGNPWRN